MKQHPRCWVFLSLLLLFAPLAAQGGADRTFDLHFRFYCDPPAGPNL